MTGQTGTSVAAAVVALGALAVAVATNVHAPGKSVRVIPAAEPTRLSPRPVARPVLILDADVPGTKDHRYCYVLDSRAVKSNTAPEDAVVCWTWGPPNRVTDKKAYDAQNQIEATRLARVEAVRRGLALSPE